jgi:ABC-2 type transport system permease protein
MIQKFAEGNNSMMDMMTGIFITSKFSSYGLLYNNEFKGLLYIMLSLVLSIIVFIAYYYIGGKLYLKGIIGISESYSKRENILENGKANNLIKINSPIKALVKKDIKVILRTPQFFINCIAMIFYIPAIMGVAMLSNGQLSKFRTMLSNGTQWYAIAIAISFIGGAICIIGGGAGATALSREGKDFMVSKYIPVSYKIQLHSKILSSLCINELGAVIVTLVLILVGANPILLLLGIISSIGSIALITLFGMYIDFKFPKLNWENERAMFKKNYMPLLIMLIVFLLGAILVIAAIILKNYIIIFGISIAVVVIGSLILYRSLIKLANKVYNEN